MTMRRLRRRTTAAPAPQSDRRQAANTSKPPPRRRRTRHHCLTAAPTLTNSRPSCMEAVLDALDRLQQRTGATEFTRCFIVAEVQATDAGSSGRPSTGVYGALPAMNLVAPITTFK